MVRSTRCESCGALASPGRCRYCGALARTEELVAAGFGAGDDMFAVMPDDSGVRVSMLGQRALRVDVPSEDDVGPAVVGCAWTRGKFVDLDVSVAIRFERAPEGIRAGVWLRSGKMGAVCATLDPSGQLSVVTRRDEGREIAQLGSVPASPGFSGEPIVVRVKVIGDLLTIFRNGTGVMSVTCPTDLVGGADLVVEVPRHDRGCVVFDDVCARLP